MAETNALQSPSVFIGCASSALPLAEALKQALGGSIRAKVWNEDAVKAQADVSFTDGAVMANLFQTARLYDFAIMILRADDVLAEDGEGGGASRRVGVPRDNVIFELGLFMGAIGGQRALAVVCGKGLRLPSDLYGFDQVTLAGESDVDIAVAAAEILGKIEASYAALGLSLLPSTGLAIGYFNNFIRPVCRYLEENEIVIDGRAHRPGAEGYLFDIVIPSSLDLAGTEGKAAFLKQQGEALTMHTVKLAARDYPFSVRVNSDEAVLHIIDYPTPLSASVAAIALVLNEELAMRAGDAKPRLEEREIANFRASLVRLLQQEALSAADDASRRFPARVRLVQQAP